jgi:UTP--glucose-1-phosphate uridylyltransferase
VRIQKAIFPVGGMGTRFLPATKAMPKEMLPIVDKPIIQHAVEEAWAAGLDKCIFVTGRGKTAIEDHFDYSYELSEMLAAKNKIEFLDKVQATVPRAGHVAYIRQQEPLGLGHAVWCARHYVGQEPFAVLLADDVILGEDPCLKQMVEVFQTLPQPANMLAIAEVPHAHTNLYGIITPESQEGALIKVKGIVEKPKPEDAPSNLAVIGRYIIQPEVFAHLAKQEKGSGGEIQLTDALAALMKEQAFYGYRFKGERYDCGNHLGYIQANIVYGLSQKHLKDPLLQFMNSYKPA